MKTKQTADINSPAKTAQPPRNNRASAGKYDSTVSIKADMEEGDLASEVEEIQKEMEKYHIKVNESLMMMKRRLLRHSVLHQNCQQMGFQDIPFTTISYKEIMQMTEEVSKFPAHVMVNKCTQKERDEELIPRVASDGSVLNKRGRKVASFGIFWGEGSPLNESSIVLNNSSSMIPEVAGMTRTMEIAKEEGIKKLVIICDSIPCINFIIVAKLPPTNSRTLQDFLNEHPGLEEYAIKVREVIKNFSFLAVAWQKAHTTSISVNARMNNASDELARTRAEEVLRAMN